VRVGIITFDTRINFYDVRPHAREPIKSMIQHPDDCFPPAPLSHWLHSPYLHDTDNGDNYNNNVDKNINNYNNDYNNSNTNSYSNSNYHTPQHPTSTGGLKPPLTGTPGPGVKRHKLLLLLERLLLHCASEQNAGQNALPDANCQESCPMEALKAAQACLADTGGRVILLTSSALGCGMGRGAEGVKSAVQGQVLQSICSLFFIITRNYKLIDFLFVHFLFIDYFTRINYLIDL
jgi:Sec23/Sec24 trunk domain